MYDLIDLNFQGQFQTIASYAVRGPGGVALVETGPGSTLPALWAGLHARGIAAGEITDILVTHIHLDHAGAAGRLALETGATVHVHHIGAPHLADPAKLLASANRIYGDLMDVLWGEFLPAPAAQLHALHDGDVIAAAGLRFTALDTPGHAYHHMAYLLDGLCFAGDVAAVRLPGSSHIRLPVPPPEIDLPAWQASLARLRALRPDQLLLTHFGAAGGDPLVHLAGVSAQLDAYTAFFRSRWQAGETAATITPHFQRWIAALAAADGCDAATAARYETTVPAYMQAEGMLRYFRKFEAV